MMEPIDECVRSRVAVITGCSRGIGAEICRRLHMLGYAVAGVSRFNPAPLANKCYLCDVSKESEVASACAEIIRDFGRVDVLVNAAGVASFAGLRQTSYEQWNQTLGVNLGGAFLFSRELLPTMLKQGWGRIVNIASVASKRGDPHMIAYSVSKHALIGLTRCVALETAKAGVTVNAICAGAIETDLLKQGLQGWADETGRAVEVGKRLWQACTPQGRFFEKSEVAGMVAYLISEDAKGVTGQAMNICGGAIAF